MGVVGYGRRRSLAAFARRYPFELAIVVAALAYALLQLSPSSYALALAQLGQPVSPWLGSPQAIRSDEWAIMTPLFESTVNNHFRVINATSFYHETLLSDFGLPLRNWGLIFKPELWSFFVLPASYAYSLYWATMAGLMLIGWSLILRAFGFRRSIAALLACLLFLSPFVQAWWTTFASQLAFFPWIVLVIAKVRSNLRVALVLALLIPVWWLSFFYAPQFPPLLLLALALCIAFRRDLLTWKRVAAVACGGAVGAGIAFLYLRPIVSAYENSVFPGHRWLTGGGMPIWQVLSQLLPGTTTEHYTSLLASNICEVSTVATWLPVLTVCLLDYGASRRLWQTHETRRQVVWPVGVLLGSWLLVTLWQVTSIMVPLRYLLVFGISPVDRTLFASGTLLVVAAAVLLERLPIRVTALRLGAFSCIVAGAWIAASLRLQPTNVLEPRDELLVLLPVAALLPVSVLGRTVYSADAWRITAVVVCLIPVAAVWGLFNPIQRTNVIFRKPNTPVTRRLDRLADKRPDHAIAATGFAGGVLNGVGYRSVSQIIPTPSPQLFKRFFPTMQPIQFDFYFNRYANYGLADVKQPTLITDDYVQLPIDTMSNYAASP
jgi:hypothetical protein